MSCKALFSTIIVISFHFPLKLFMGTRYHSIIQRKLKSFYIWKIVYTNPKINVFTMGVFTCPIQTNCRAQILIHLYCVIKYSVVQIGRVLYVIKHITYIIQFFVFAKFDIQSQSYFKNFCRNDRKCKYTDVRGFITR